MGNRLVKLMPPEIRSELQHAGGEFCLAAGETIPAESLEGSFVFIIDEGVASKFVRSEWGHYSEVGMVGPEGLFPICGLLDVPAAPHTVISQIGELKGRRMRSREFHAIIGESPEARLLVRKYIYSFVTQIASNILTAEQDVVEKRLARWLLMCHDRIEGDEIAITHEILAQMAFAQRPTVTSILHDMRGAGMIELARGKIKVSNRDDLRYLAGGSYGPSEAYWCQQIGPFRHQRDDDLDGDTIAA